MPRKARPAPQTDLQARLRHIQEESERIRQQHGGRDAAADLAYLVGYLARLVEQQVSGERK